MRRAGTAAAASLLALTAPAAPARPPARMLVTADEWTLVASRQAVRPGRLEIQLYNRGEDAHDLAARRVTRDGGRTGRTYRLAETKPGGLGEAAWRLKRGRYALWCDLPGHREAGMRATLRVRQPSAGRS